MERSARKVAAYSTDAAKAGYRVIRSKENILQRRAEQKMAGEEVAQETSSIRIAYEQLTKEVMRLGERENRRNEASIAR